MKITEFLEKIFLFCFESKKNARLDNAIAVAIMLIINIVIIESNKDTDLRLLGITPFTSIACLILLLNQYLFGIRKPKVVELIKGIFIIILPAIIYLLVILKPN